MGRNLLLFTTHAFQATKQLGTFLLETAKHPTCNLFADRGITIEKPQTGEGLNTDKLLFAFQTAEEKRPHNRTTNCKVLS